MAFTDMLQYLRMQNLFGQQPPVPGGMGPMMGNDLPQYGGITGNMPPPEVQAPPIPTATQAAQPLPPPPDVTGSPEYDVDARMQQLYHPQTEASDRFEHMIGEYPDREANKPSLMRKIGASLMAVSSGMAPGRGLNFYHANPAGIKAGMDFRDEPFENKKEDWKAKIIPAQQAATNERYQNVNDRTTAYQTISNELKSRSDEARIAKDEARTKIMEDRSEVYRLKSLSPNYVFDFKGPFVVAMDKKTGKGNVTKIPTGSLTETDKIALNQENALERIEATGDEARKTERVRQEGRVEMGEYKDWHITNIPDPNDPTGQRLIGVRVSPDGSRVEPLRINPTAFKSQGATNPDGSAAPQGTTTPPTSGTPADAGTTTTTVTTPQAGAKSLETMQMKKVQREAVINKTQEALHELDNLLDSKGNLTPTAQTAVGKSSFFNFIPTTEGYAGRASINRLKSQQIINLIGEMKAQSRTGATGFGQLSIKELGVLEDAATKLDTGLDEETFRVELKRIREKLQKILQPDSGMEPTARPAKLSPQQLIDKYGGGQ